MSPARRAAVRLGLALGPAIAAAACGGGGAGGPDSAGGAHPVAYLYTFDRSTDVGNAAIANVSDMDPNDLGAHGGATKMFDPGDGDPAAGSMAVSLACTAYGQFVDYQFVLPFILDMSARTLSMQIKLDSGFTQDPNVPGGVIMYAKSGDNWDWGQAEWAAIPRDAAGAWREYTFSFTTPGSGSAPAFDPAYVRAIGLQLSTGNGAGATAAPVPAMFHVDSIGYR